MDQTDPFLQMVPFPIERGNFQGFPGKIQGIDLRIGKGIGAGDGDAAAASTQIENIFHPFAVYPGGKCASINSAMGERGISTRSST